VLFLYAELFVLLVVSFGVGAAVAAVVTRAVVKAMPAELAGGPTRAADGAAAVESGGTP
jgi:hypothetical protein